MNTRSEFVTLLGKEVCDCIEYRAKHEWLHYFLDLIAEYKLKYDQSIKRDDPYFVREAIAEQIRDSEKKVRWLRRRLRQLARGEDEEITQEDIQKAKETPIEEIIEVRKGKAICPNHKDRRPSMDCRNGFSYCYVCGYRGDVIDVYMKINGVSFPEAVRALNGSF